jgi:hypothetical protein
MSFPTYFAPHSSVIQDISNASHAVVTTTTDHGLLTGMVVSIQLPLTGNFGMSQFPRPYSSYIGVISPTQFIIGIDTSGFDPFVLDAKQSAQAIPVATFYTDIPPISDEATQNDGHILPEYSWTNTSFPWVNNNNYVGP